MYEKYKVASLCKNIHRDKVQSRYYAYININAYISRMHIITRIFTWIIKMFLVSQMSDIIAPDYNGTGLR